MQLVRITIRITRRITFTDQMGIIVVLPPVPVRQSAFQPILPTIERRPVDVRPDERRPPSDHRLPKPRPDVDPSLLPRADAGQNPIRPPGPQPNGQLLRKRQHIPNRRSRSIPNHILHCTDYLTTCLNSATTVFVCVLQPYVIVTMGISGEVCSGPLYLSLVY